MVAGDDIYGGTSRLLDQVLPGMGVEVANVDHTDLNAYKRAFIDGRTKLVLLESPTNPRMRVRCPLSVESALVGLSASNMHCIACTPRGSHLHYIGVCSVPRTSASMCDCVLWQSHEWKGACCCRSLLCADLSTNA